MCTCNVYCTSQGALVNLWRRVVIVAGAFCATRALYAAAKPTGRVLARTAVEIDIVK